MSAHLYRADSGGVARKAKLLYRADSAGIARKIKKLYRADASGVARLVFSGQGTYSGTLSTGTDGTFTGYSSVPGDVFGSINPTTDSNGNAIQTLYNYPGLPGTPYVQLSIVGASYQDYFNTLTAPGIGSLLAAAASGFSFSGGVGTWQWNTSSVPTSGSWSIA